MTCMLPYTVFNAIKKVTPRKKIREINSKLTKKKKNENFLGASFSIYQTNNKEVPRYQ